MSSMICRIMKNGSWEYGEFVKFDGEFALIKITQRGLHSNYYDDKKITIKEFEKYYADSKEEALAKYFLNKEEKISRDLERARTKVIELNSTLKNLKDNPDYKEFVPMFPELKI